jgi:hypothetical protein
MAKMFYTLEEVCQKLGKTEDEVREMARSGQIQEFRDRDKLMFKVDQIDLLAGGDDDTGDVHLELEDTSGGSGLALKDESAIGLEESRELSGSGIALEESRESTGISVFDTDHGAEDSTERTHGGEGPAAQEEEELSLESVGSGSGLLDLTRESDDTSLGAELLEEVYSGDENIEIPGSASGLFEPVTAEASSEPSATAPVGLAGAVPMLIEAYDGAGSGLGAGLLIGALVALVCVSVIVVVGVFGATPELAVKMAGSATSLMIWGGGLLAGTIILGIVGFIIGKATE